MKSARRIDGFNIIFYTALIDLGFKGQRFTRCNKKDGFLVNVAWQSPFLSRTPVLQDPSTGSDHLPWTIDSDYRGKINAKPFRFE